MLGRAKWDAWAKHKDLDLTRQVVLRKYSDKTVARDLVRELESYGGDPANLVHSGTFSRSPDSDSSSEEGPGVGTVYRSAQVHHHARGGLGPPREGSASEEETTDDEATDLRAPEPALNRSQSALSSHRYDTRPSFGGSVSTLYPPSSTEQAIPRDAPSFPGHSSYRRPPSARPHALSASGLPHRPSSRIALERAIEVVQTQLAALSERMESIELNSSGTQPLLSPPGPGSRDITPWNFDEMGLWAIVFKGMARVLASLRQISVFLSDSDGRSPTFVVIRQVGAAIRALWCALVGKTPARSMAFVGIESVTFMF
ncbi:hypothetical protein EI94DRAFT_1728163 [Lactarius quietus]|nr:hypothetical protein EI94DRAFT_1728163 [Lactarius quietus]